MTAMAEPAPAASKRHPLLPAGLALMGCAVVWWLSYSSQWQGFVHLDVNFACLNGAAMECGKFQDLIGPAVSPVYSPLALVAGIGLTLVGLYLTRRQKV